MHETAARAARAITQLDAQATGKVGDSLHRPRQNPNPVAKQRRIRGVMDVGLHDSRVDPHLAATDDLFLLSNRHDPLMDLPDDRGAQCESELAQRLGVGHLGGTDAGELATIKLATRANSLIAASLPVTL